MDSKELVYHALAFEKVPRVPYCVDFTVPAKERLNASASGRELYKKLDNDMVLSPVNRVEWGKRDANGVYKDEFGLVWDRKIDADIGMPQAFITPENIDTVPWPDPKQEERYVLLRDNLERCPDKFNILAVDFSLFERAWGMRGMENFLIDMVINREFAEKLLDKVLEFNLQIMETGLSKFPGVDGVHFGDDFGTQSGLLMGPALWRELLKPRLAQQYGLVHSYGKKVSIHSCGKVLEIFDDLIEIGVECFNPFQPEVMDVKTVHSAYFGRMAFWGGVSTQRLLPYATIDEVRTGVEELLSMGRSGGYIISPAHSTPGDARVENMETMLRMIIDQ